jgi:hypothetical protein
MLMHADCKGGLIMGGVSTTAMKLLIIYQKKEKGKNSMACCEKCWKDAYTRSRISGMSQGDCYIELLKERESNPCSPKNQAGDYWDDELQKDKREMEDD